MTMQKAADAIGEAEAASIQAAIKVMEFAIHALPALHAQPVEPYMKAQAVNELAELVGSALEVVGEAYGIHSMAASIVQSTGQPVPLSGGGGKP